MSNEELLASVIPNGVFWKIAEDWMWDVPVSPAEESLIEKAVEKRKREFRAGRHCAHFLFNAHKIDCDALLKGIQREPAWPRGWVGSISHTQGLCVVAIAPADRYLSIGLDVEQAAPLNSEIRNLICTQREQDMLDRILLQHGNEFANVPLDKVIFSAKESIHKTYFPLNYHTLDFLDAELALDVVKNSFEALIIKPEATPKRPIRRLDGRFNVNSYYVASCIAVRK